TARVNDAATSASRWLMPAEVDRWNWRKPRWRSERWTRRTLRGIYGRAGWAGAVRRSAAVGIVQRRPRPQRRRPAPRRLRRDALLQLRPEERLHVVRLGLQRAVPRPQDVVLAVAGQRDG